MKIKAQYVECPPDEEHILRRLGGAVVILWDALPEEAREQIKLQAVFMIDRDNTVQLEQQINIFIEDHKIPNIGKILPFVSR